jgi:cbb3-type cytochrome oxidase cytochrome c subunit/mono/diheme cytochrome c family protein
MQAEGSKAERPIFVLAVAGVGFFVLSFVGMGLAPWIGLNLGLEAPEGFTNPYRDEDGNLTAIGRGRQVYINEVCWHCHSQFVRPIGNEEFRYGPVSQAWEAMHDVPNTYGTRRIGPDLSRTAGRRSDDWHFAHLWNPRSTVPASIMPKYPWLFIETEDGIEPTQKAQDLVSYLQHLGHAFEEDVRRQVWPSRVTVSGAPADSPEQYRRGENLFKHYCTGCHGEQGDGDGMARPFLAPSAADLTTRYLPREEVFRILFMGSEGSSMPSYSELTEKDLWALSQYVHELGRTARQPALVSARDAARVEQGREVYAQLCQLCHGPDGMVTEQMEAALKPSPKHFRDRLYTPEYVRQVLREGRPGTTMPGFPDLTEEQIQALTAYMASLFDEAGYKE